MKQSGFRLFLLIWIGSLISEIGSGMTSFALGVYIFQLTGLVSISSFVTLCAFLPGQWHRRRVLRLPENVRRAPAILYPHRLPVAQCRAQFIEIQTGIGTNARAKHRHHSL